MNMKLKFFLVAVGALTVFASLAVAHFRVAVVPSQVAVMPLRPFVLVTTHTGPVEDNGLPWIHTEGLVVREDGSYVRLASITDAKGELLFSHTVVDFRNMTEVYVEPISESVSTTALPWYMDVQTRIKPEAHCGKPAGKILDIPVEYREEDEQSGSPDAEGFAHQAHFLTKEWAAPSLGCSALRTDWTMFKVDGKSGNRVCEITNSLQAVWIEFRPVDGFFEVPPSYTERNPVEIDNEMARRQPSLFYPTKEDEFTKRKIAVYNEWHAALAH
jgi:hypothetical protein